jgi:hypothetical protein
LQQSGKYAKGSAVMQIATKNVIDDEIVAQNRVRLCEGGEKIIPFRWSAIKHETPMHRHASVVAPYIQPFSTHVQFDIGEITTAAKIARRMLRRQRNPNAQSSGNKISD